MYMSCGAKAAAFLNCWESCGSDKRIKAGRDLYNLEVTAFWIVVAGARAMNRRTVLQAGMSSILCSRLQASLAEADVESASGVMQQAVDGGLVSAAALYVDKKGEVFQRAFGLAKSTTAVFLLASITKPMTAAVAMRIYDQGYFDLDDRAQRFLPEFTGDGREQITIRQLLTHISGLPDQLPENEQLRTRHAELGEFTERALHTPLLFVPGTRYSYSSMAILLIAEIAQRITGQTIATLMQSLLFEPLGMARSALGIGHLDFEGLMQCQVESSAPESGAGDPDSKSWDWNSKFWRQLGAPWGGAHGSAADVATFLRSFLRPEQSPLKVETARMMIRNQNPPKLRTRGLAFDLGPHILGAPENSLVFGHTGSTGTICWADPRSETICVVLSTLPARAVNPHPITLTSSQVAETIQ